jgi:hypothetical protein
MKRFWYVQMLPDSYSSSHGYTERMLLITVQSYFLIQGHALLYIFHNGTIFCVSYYGFKRTTVLAFADMFQVFTDFAKL